MRKSAHEKKMTEIHVQWGLYTSIWYFPDQPICLCFFVGPKWYTYFCVFLQGFFKHNKLTTPKKKNKFGSSHM